MQVLFNAPDDDVRVDGKDRDKGRAGFAEEDIDSVEQLKYALGIARVQAWLERMIDWLNNWIHHDCQMNQYDLLRLSSESLRESTKG